jgi:DNA-binding CsgD family transcriptional regulator
VESVLAAAGHADFRRGLPRPAGLSEREVEVLRLIARGSSNREVARLLSISAKTVGHHVGHIYAKVGVSTQPAVGDGAADSRAARHRLRDGPVWPRRER